MLERKNFISVQDNSFIGIKVIDNEIKFYYPKTYQLSDDLRTDALNILRTFKLVSTRSKDESNYNSKYSANEVFPLESYFWILNDYFENKRYVNKEKSLKYGVQGKVEWTKTMKQIPYYSNSTFVYPRLISSVNRQADNLLTEVYAYCVNTAIEEVGWYYDLKNKDDSLGYYKKNTKRYISILKDEINKTFDDKKRQRLIHMKNIITGLDIKDISSHNYVRGIDSYEHVFETMVDKMFGNVAYKKKFFPSGQWDLIVNGSKESSKLRPDSIIIKDRKVYILDSKYYRYGITFDFGDLPDTTSIEKQITYGEYAEKIGTDYDEVFNAFVLPYNKSDNPHKDIFNEDLVFVGTAFANWPQVDTASKKIATILIDTRFLIENYLRENDKTTEKLIKMIEDHVKELQDE